MITSNQKRCRRDSEPKKAACPLCKNPNTHKRKHAPGWYCFTCKVAFRDSLTVEPNVKEVV